MPIPARLQTTEEGPNRRASTRHKICLDSSVHGDPVTIHDLSATGMLIETSAKLNAFDALEIDLPEAGTTSALVIWHSGRYFGCEFKEPVFTATVSAARLRSPPAIELVQDPLPSDGVTAPTPEVSDNPETPIAIGEEKARLAVRLRVILGSAIMLWALIIWAIVNLTKSARAFFG